MINTIKKILNNKKGFTLIELIVVMAILGIIAAIAIPNFTGIQNQSKIKADYATAAQIVKAARVQEVNTGTPVADIDNLKTDYFNSSKTPQSDTDGKFTLTGGGNSNYTVTWDPANGAAQTYEENQSDFNIDQEKKSDDDEEDKE